MLKKIILPILLFFFYPLFQSVSSKGIKVSIVDWGFRFPFDFVCKVAKENGIHAFELSRTNKWERVNNKGMKILISNGADLGIERGFCNPDFHEVLKERYMKLIPQAAESGVSMLICYAGINTRFSSEQALENCYAGLEPIIRKAESYGVTIVMELISSKPSQSNWWQFTFPYYVCDHAAWGVALAEKLNSPNFKLLYNIWQMNDMGANIIEDIEHYYPYIAHFRIAGDNHKNLKENNSIDYPSIIKTIRRTEFSGHIGIEFLIEKQIPESIEDAVTFINQ